MVSAFLVLGRPRSAVPSQCLTGGQCRGGRRRRGRRRGECEEDPQPYVVARLPQLPRVLCDAADDRAGVPDGEDGRCRPARPAEPRGIQRGCRTTAGNPAGAPYNRGASRTAAGLTPRYRRQACRRSPAERNAPGLRAHEGAAHSGSSSGQAGARAASGLLRPRRTRTAQATRATLVPPPPSPPDHDRSAGPGPLHSPGGGARPPDRQALCGILFVLRTGMRLDRLAVAVLRGRPGHGS